MSTRFVIAALIAMSAAAPGIPAFAQDQMAHSTSPMAHASPMQSSRMSTGKSSSMPMGHEKMGKMGSGAMHHDSMAPGHMSPNAMSPMGQEAKAPMQPK